MNGKHYVEYSYSSDIWSLGMIFYFLCFGQLPYSQIDDFELLKQEILAFKSKNVSIDYELESEHQLIPIEILQLIRIMLSPNPNERPGARFH